MPFSDIFLAQVYFAGFFLPNYSRNQMITFFQKFPSLGTNSKLISYFSKQQVAGSCNYMKLTLQGNQFLMIQMGLGSFSTFH